jgi:flagellar biosynthesis/type III secretory pathway protein FliH
MSAIIKSSSAQGLSSVRPLPVANIVPLDEVRSKEEAERERLQKRIAILEGDLRQSETANAGLRAEVEATFVQGKAQGHEEGFAAAEKREGERLSLLESALHDGLEVLATSLASLERLSLLLARDALEIILGDPDYRREILEKIIASQVAKIEKAALVEIAVSAEDFPEKRPLSALAKRSGIGSATMVASSDISSGNCLMKLRLGSQEIGLQQQWGALRDRFAELSLPQEVP